MKMENNRLQYLFESYYNKTDTLEERSELLAAIRDQDGIEMLSELIQHAGENLDVADFLMSESRKEKMLKDILGEEEELTVIDTRNHKRWWGYVAAAAIIGLIIGSGYFLWNDKGKDKSIASKEKITLDVDPGREGAILVLANGQKVTLDSIGSGALATQGNTAIRKQDGQIVYSTEGASDEILYNTLSTPKGRQYSLVLADGSRVWLNAASSITYPIAFKGGGERKVSITGEVYFEVSHDPSRPFRVSMTTSSGPAEVEVLGTHFNINSYSDEAIAKTTLLEGKVKVVASDGAVLLSPGQQAQINTNGKMKTVNDIDMEEVVAWKNGFFEFNNVSLDGVLRQVARWYDIEIVYQTTIPKREFAGKMERDLKLTQVLKILEKYDVHYRIESGKLFIIP